jgi:hypothetical protein
LFFGTNFGRWLTQYLFVPFGGAYLTLEFVRHLVAKMSDEPVPANAQGTTVPVAQTAASWLCRPQAMTGMPSMEETSLKSLCAGLSGASTASTGT